jgi:hypothetical protein
MTQITIYIALSHDGSYEVAPDEQDAWDRLESKVGIDGPVRVFKVSLEAKAPALVEVSGSIKIPDETGNVTQA